MKSAGRPASLAPTKSAGRALLPDLRQMILVARDQVTRAVNITLVALNREIGRRIRQNVLGEKRAIYGAKIVSTLSRQLAWSQWPVTALLFLDARDLDEATAIAASHPAKNYNVAMEVRSWSPPNPVPQN